MFFQRALACRRAGHVRPALGSFTSSARAARARMAPIAVGAVAVATALFVSPARAADATSAVTPGGRFEESIRRSLATPSEASRWRGLAPFGRGFFVADSTPGPSDNVPVGPGYVLGPGDELRVFVSSLADTAYALTVDREGQVFLPRVGSTSLWGLSFDEATSLIRSRIATVLRNARVQVSMGRLRTIDVFVLGEVARPGPRTLCGLVTAFSALSSAGGPTERGSFRDVRVLRANREAARFDLYPFLLEGDRAQDVRLEQGDVVFVGVIGSRAGLQGEVNRPGVYECNSPISLRALLALGAGATPFADLTRIQIERFEPGGGLRIEDVALDDVAGAGGSETMIFDHDLVTVLPANGRVESLVTLDGFVRQPGSYELAAHMRLSDLVTAERFLPEASHDHAEFRRIDPVSFAVEVRHFSPREVFEGRLDWPLESLDAVTVFSSARLPRSVTLEGEVERPGVYSLSPGERLSEALARAGGVTPRGSISAAVFRRESAVRAGIEAERGFEERQRLEMSRERLHAVAVGDSTSAGQLGAAQAQLLDAFERASHPERVILDLDDGGRWAGSERDPVLEDGDRLYVPEKPSTVAVLGSVRSPGTLLLPEPERGGEILRRSGGLARDAELDKSYVLRTNGEAVAFTRGTRVEAGDAVVIVPRTPERRSGGVLSGARFAIELAAAAALIMAAAK